MTLQVQLLTGVARYSEMTFIFDLLKEHDQFELLFGKGMEKVRSLADRRLLYIEVVHVYHVV